MAGVMRLDDGNSQSYAPVLRRIIILLAVITAIPVMLWTITAFMRTYVAQPVIASARPMAAAAVTPAADAASSTAPVETAVDASPPPLAPIIVEARATSTDARSSYTDSKGDRVVDAAAKVAALATADITPTSAPMAAPPAAADTVAAQSAPAPGSPWPDAAPSLAPAPDAQPAQPAAPTDSAADALPPAAPLIGPIPLPPRRPTVFALVETGGVPLPRARPAIAPEPTSPPPPSNTTYGYKAGLGPDHY
jgi:hypothetical protein